jgi:hypothetical protein
METSATLREDSRSKINKIVIAIALALTICGVAARPALADHDHHGNGHHRGNGWHNGWRHHGNERHWREPDVYYAPAPNHYYAPRGYYYAPPPVVYYPRPRSGLDLFFGLR